MLVSKFHVNDNSKEEISIYDLFCMKYKYLIESM